MSTFTNWRTPVIVPYRCILPPTIRTLGWISAALIQTGGNRRGGLLHVQPLQTISLFLCVVWDVPLFMWEFGALHYHQGLITVQAYVVTHSHQAAQAGQLLSWPWSFWHQPALAGFGCNRCSGKWKIQTGWCWFCPKEKCPSLHAGHTISYVICHDDARQLTLDCLWLQFTCKFM